MKKLLFIGMLLIGLSLQGWSQEKTITVTGIVTDTEKEPLIGVNISVQDMPGLGVITDINGRYRINVPAYNRLIFSYVGYETVSVLIKEQTVVNVTMKEAASTVIDEVVVTGLGAQKEDCGDRCCDECGCGSLEGCTVYFGG